MIVYTNVNDISEFIIWRYPCLSAKFLLESFQQSSSIFEIYKCWIYGCILSIYTSYVIYCALINRARGPYKEIFVLTFKAYGANAVRSMRLECQNKYFPYGPKSRLIRALLYTYTNKIVYDEILLS